MTQKYDNVMFSDGCTKDTIKTTMSLLRKLRTLPNLTVLNINIPDQACSNASISQEMSMSDSMPRQQHRGKNSAQDRGTNLKQSTAITLEKRTSQLWQ